jgi:hypothetical protein
MEAQGLALTQEPPSRVADPDEKRNVWAARECCHGKDGPDPPYSNYLPTY